VTHGTRLSSIIHGDLPDSAFREAHVLTVYRSISALAIAFTALTAADAAAQGNGNKKSAKPAASVERHGTVIVTTDDEVRVFRQYYSGKKKPKALPPGIARNLARGKPLPPGLSKSRLPADLVRRLPERQGYEWAVASDVVILIDAGGIVRDILRNIF